MSFSVTGSGVDASVNDGGIRNKHMYVRTGIDSVCERSTCAVPILKDLLRRVLYPLILCVTPTHTDVYTLVRTTEYENKPYSYILQIFDSTPALEVLVRSRRERKSGSSRGCF